MTGRYKFILTAGAALALLSAMLCVGLSSRPSLAQEEIGRSIVVLVNDEPITQFDVSQRVRFTEVTQRKDVDAGTRKKIIEDLIAERVQIQEARKSGVVVSEADIDAVLENMAKGNDMTKDQLVAALAQVGVRERTLRDRIRAGIGWREVSQKKFRMEVNIGNSDVDRAMTGQEGEGTKKEEVQIQRIRLDIADRTDTRAVIARLSEAETLRQRISSCGQVESAVNGVSKASVRAIEKRMVDQVPQPTRAYLLAAQPGQVTPPSITGSSIELYALCDRKTIVSDEEQRQEVRRKLLVEEFGRLSKRYLDDARSAAYVEYRN
ncbi:MAG: SurA N-terminal domain-containing protein [Hyphomicrobiales bacterium]